MAKRDMASLMPKKAKQKGVNTAKDGKTTKTTITGNAHVK